MSTPPRHSLKGARWLPPQSGAAGPRIAQLASSLQAGPLLAAVLFGRGYQDSSCARAFLEGGAEGLHDPLLLPDMSRAVEMIADAIEKKERIRLHGDYDVDGVSACALLWRALSSLGAEVDVHLPHRLHDGYGLGKAAVEKAAADGVQLLLTADCGSGSPEAVAHALSLGLRVIVTDHHEVQSPESRVKGHGPATVSGLSTLDPRLSTNFAEVNPHRPDSRYPFSGLSGVGVAGKLVEALAARRGLAPRSHWVFNDLVALGTVADVSPLLDENRVMVKQGLELIGKSRKVGICALLKAVGLSAPVSSRQVAFALAPRLNAAGRLAHPDEAFRLLTTSDAAEAASLAETLCRHNRSRQEEEARTLAQAQEMIAADGRAEEERILLLAGEGWHPGVIGIVASRLVEAYHRPVFLAALTPNSQLTTDNSQLTTAVGSARSVPGFPLCDALQQCSPLLVRHGGHEMAAGFSVLPENIPALRESLLQLAEQWLSDEHLQPALQIDAEARLADMTLPAVKELSRLEPTGAGNPQPVILLRNLSVAEVSRVGNNGGHLRLRLRDSGGPALRAVWFGHGALAEKLGIGQNIDICLNPTTAAWNGATTVELKVKDIAVERLP